MRKRSRKKLTVEQKRQRAEKRRATLSNHAWFKARQLPFPWGVGP